MKKPRPSAPRLLPFSVSSLLLILSFNASLTAQVSAPAGFLPPLGEWLDGINWSGGNAPGPTTDATLDGTKAVLDGHGLTVPFVVKSITLTNQAELELRNVRLQADLIDATNARVTLINSHIMLGTFSNAVFSSFKLNPSLLEAQVFQLLDAPTGTFGLGGIAPAAAGALGAGHYARVVCNTATLSGTLELKFLYGFVPQAGQQFEIIKNNGSVPATGTFANAPEGGLVTRYNNLGLYLSYVGGDGNDVVVTVQNLPITTAPLVHASQDGDGFAPATWSDGGVPAATKEHVLFARQISLVGTTPGQSVAMKSLTLRDGADFTVSNLTLTADLIDSVGSSVHLINSHVVLGTFSDPFGTFKLNPSLLEAQVFQLLDAPTGTFGLGGTTPAAAGALGAGHYARVVCNTASLTGNLELNLLYGFMPQAGQQFEIIRVNTPNGVGTGLTGRFANVREGGAAGVFGDVVLLLSYVGGDGNDVVLSAVERPRLLQPVMATGGFSFSYLTEQGRLYTVETTADLVNGPWTPVTTVLGDGNPQTFFQATQPQPSYFFRVLNW